MIYERDIENWREREKENIHIYATARTWRTEANFLESFSHFNHVASGDPIQFVRLGSKHLYLIKKKSLMLWFPNIFVQSFSICAMKILIYSICMMVVLFFSWYGGQCWTHKWIETHYFCFYYCTCQVLCISGTPCHWFILQPWLTDISKSKSLITELKVKIRIKLAFLVLETLFISTLAKLYITNQFTL